MDVGNHYKANISSVPVLYETFVRFVLMLGWQAIAYIYIRKRTLAFTFDAAGSHAKAPRDLIARGLGGGP